MCGIVGIINGNSSLIELMLQTISHRGPDGMQVFIKDNIALGHARLSIIDLSSRSSQPFHYSSPSGNSYTIVFNGEIYNYIEIKDILLEKGYLFNTTSDTEVLVAAYACWGADFLSRLNGMWSFVIYDESANKLFVSRDRFGVKPLYYSTYNNSFIFSSEIKSILYYYNHLNADLKIDHDALELYFSLGYIPSPYSIFSGIKKLSSSHILEYDIASQHLSISKYYKPPALTKKFNQRHAIEEFDHLFDDAVKIRLRSDVKVGAFLSGGVDSTSVVRYMMKNCDAEKLHTYSIGFEGKYDETFYIKIAKDSIGVKNHHHTYFCDDDFLKYQKSYFESFDEPFADYSGYSSLLVSEFGKKFSTVILSGDGGDEGFGGYAIYNNAFYVDIMSMLPKKLLNLLSYQIKWLPSSQVKQYLSVAIDLAKAPKKKFVSSYLSSQRFNPKILAEWSEPRLMECLRDSDNKLSTGLILFDQMHNTLPDKYLTKVDRTSMKYGVEVRSPYLDYRVIEFANNLPHSLKVYFNKSKIFLRDALKTKVPNEILSRPKHGFTPPLVDWITKSNDSDVYDLDILRNYSTDISKFYENFVFRKPEVKFNREYLIRLYIFNKWHKKWYSKS
jgi:asparagine synthase (glutamine-hydrolysing)